jgi:hypothetical protein
MKTCATCAHFVQNSPDALYIGQCTKLQTGTHIHFVACDEYLTSIRPADKPSRRQT